MPNEKALQDTVRGSLPEERGISRAPMLQTRWGQGAEGLLSEEGNYYCLMCENQLRSFRIVYILTLTLSKRTLSQLSQAPDL